MCQVSHLIIFVSDTMIDLHIHSQMQHS
jgi:hypothetical protein